MKHARSTSAALVLGLGLASGAAAGELRGRILADDKPVAGATVSAVPFESPIEEARREARRTEPPKTLATTTTRPDGSWVLTLTPPAGTAAVAAPAAGPALVRLKVSGGGLAPRLLEPLFDVSESALASRSKRPARRSVGVPARILSATWRPSRMSLAR